MAEQNERVWQEARGEGTGRQMRRHFAPRWLEMQEKKQEARQYFSHKIFTLEALRNARLCPSIHLESRPATLVLADTVF